MMMITSLKHPLIKDTVSESRNRERKKSGAVHVEGAREIAQALAAGFKLQRLFSCTDLLNPFSTETLARACKEFPQSDFVAVSDTVFAKLAMRENSDGLYAVFAVPQRELSERVAPGSFFLAVESVEKPGNLGAILRSADGAGVEGVFVLDQQVDPWNPQVIRASLGAAFSLPIYSVSNTEFVAFCRKNGVAIAAAALTPKSKPYSDVAFQAPIALVMGAEATGLSSYLLNEAESHLLIPMRGKVDSLNVSAAASVLAFEIRRQLSAPEKRQR